MGFPNVGKSTFISAVSAARPKIADYPFTTLEPHLGVVVTGRQGDETEFVVADIPGLVEGAAEGKGLGHRFLRHIERARVLLVLLDLASQSLPAEEQQRILLDELRRYRPELLDRPRIVCGSKADVAAAEVLDTMSGIPAVSAVTGSGMGELIGKLAALVTAAPRSRHRSRRVDRPAACGDASEYDAAGEVFVHRPIGESAVQITRGPDGTFLVGGRQALRAVALSDLTNDDALDLVQARLKRLGVERALVRAGVRDGDQVQVGDLAFTYHPDDLRPGDSEVPARKTKRARRAEVGSIRSIGSGHVTARPGQDVSTRPERVVVKIGSSSVTAADGDVDTAAIAQVVRRGRRASRGGAAGRRRHVGSDLERMAGDGQRSATDRPRHPPGGRGRRPTSTHARVRRCSRSPRVTSRARSCSPRSISSIVSSISTRARRSPVCSS